jgi:sugar/nucleoside kinase (ribokinase family)
LKSLDYLVLNQVEVKNLTGKQDGAEAWKRLSSVNSQLKLIVKLGEKGCSLIGTDQFMNVSGVNLAKLGLQVVNTVGCGDAFLGVFLASKAQGLTDQESLERANLASALKAARAETRGSPTRLELESNLNFMQKARVVKGV